MLMRGCEQRFESSGGGPARRRGATGDAPAGRGRAPLLTRYPAGPSAVTSWPPVRWAVSGL